MSQHQPPGSDDNVIRRFEDRVTVSEDTHEFFIPKIRGQSAWSRRHSGGFWSSKTLGYTKWRHERTRYWVDTPNHHYVFTSRRAKGRALCWGAIVSETGLTEMKKNDNMIPAKVAALGKPYIAAYLYAVYDLDKEEVGDKLDVAPSTISVYLSDVGAGRR